MQQKLIQYKPTGINQDLDEMAFTPDNAYDIKNMRVSATEENTVSALVNEIGTAKIDGIDIVGCPIGQATIDNKLILFTTRKEEEKPDRIYVLDPLSLSNKIIAVWEGDLSFSVNNPIETYSIYENENAIKVYWVDGKNQPRFLNISNILKDESRKKFEELPNYMFDFVPLINFSHEITVSQSYDKAGQFSSGTIQYAFTYYKKFGQQSNIFHVTPIYYIAHLDRGASPEDIVSTSFTITIKNPDTVFDSIRIYSIHRTTLDGTATVKRVIDLDIDALADNTISYTDSGTHGDVVEDAELLYVGGREITAGTITAKDGTLFLGDVSMLNLKKEDWPKITGWFNDCKEGSIPYGFRFGPDDKLIFDEFTFAGEYPYQNQLQRSSYDITTFKSGEHYRFGLLLQTKVGEWTEPIFICDATNNCRLNKTLELNSDTNLLEAKTVGLNDVEKQRVLTKAYYTLPKDFINKCKELGYVRVRPVIVYPETTDRKVLCQGVANPTLYNVKCRINSNPYSLSSWFFRPIVPHYIGDDPLNLGLNNKLKDGIVYKKYYIITADMYNVTQLKAATGIRITIKLGGGNLDDWNYALEGDTGYIDSTSAFIDVRFIGYVETKCTEYIAGDTHYDGTVYMLLCEIVGSNEELEEAINKLNAYLRVIDNGSVTKNYYIQATALNSSSFLNGVLGKIIAVNEAISLPDIIWSVQDKKLCEIQENLPKNTELSSGITYIYNNNLDGGSTLRFNNNHKASITKQTLKREASRLKGEYLASGSLVEFRHNISLPVAMSPSAELQCNMNFKANPRGDEIIFNINKFLDYVPDVFFVDQSNITINSPEIEIDQQQYNSPKLRINGIIPITGNSTALSIVTKTPLQLYRTNQANARQLTPGQVINPIGTLNCSTDGLRQRLTTCSWLDEVYTSPKKDNDGNEIEAGTWRAVPAYHTGFYVYPWQREGSLNNQSTNSRDGNNNDLGTRTATLLRKVLSNYRFSVNTSYFPTDIKEYEFSDADKNLDPDTIAKRTQKRYEIYINKCVLFNSDLVVNTLFTNSYGDASTYFGNCDLLITKTTTPIGNTVIAGGLQADYNGFCTMSETYAYMTYWPLQKGDINGYWIIVRPGGMSGYYHNSDSRRPLWWISPAAQGDGDINKDWKKKFKNRGRLCNQSDCYSVDPIKIKYKSTPHIVTSLYIKNPWPITNDDGSKEQHTMHRTLPAFVHKGYDGKPESLNEVTPKRLSGGFFFDDRIIGHYNEYIGGAQFGNIKYGFLYLVDLLQNPSNAFGGTSDDAIEANMWLPAGEPVSLLNDEDITLKWSLGDTYYQRYDCLKTYPFSLEDTNSIIEILSFMCETRINIDGRYDRNRGNVSNQALTPLNFNLFNSAYSLKDNFFNYRVLDNDMFNFYSYPCSVTWTKTKQNGEKIDTWTNVTMASVHDVDNQYGRIRRLVNLNNDILAFQDEGICQILFNEQMLMTTTEGVPVEISNSQKVTGSRYVATKYGTINKWSVCQTPSGVYFIDDINRGIMLFNKEAVHNLSELKGMMTFSKRMATHNVWDPSNFRNEITYYEPNERDVYFIWKDQCLAYNEAILKFTSFYSYNDTPYLSTIKGTSIWVKADGSIWKHRCGEYCKFFGESEDFYILIVSNPDPDKDKIFTTIDFRSDTYKNNILLTDTTFTNIYVKNEYQEGRDVLNKYNKKVMKKFRIWRALIPRHNINSGGKLWPQDRIRNPWAYITLSMEGQETQYKTVLHDMVVNYFV